MMKKGFTLLELMIVIGLIGVIALFGWFNLNRVGVHQELSNVKSVIVALLRDAQQRSVTQTDGLYWGVKFDNIAGRDYFSLFSTSDNPESGPVSSLNTISLVTLNPRLYFRTPADLTSLTVVFNQITGELALPVCPGASSSIVIEVGIVNDPSSFATIEIFCNGRIENEIGPLAQKSDPENVATSAAADQEVVWNNPTYAKKSNNLYARAANLFNNETHWLEATNFTFNIPVNAVIVGIEAFVEGHCNPCDGNNLSDSHLIKGGVQVGNEIRGNYNLMVWTPIDTVYNLGSNYDLWRTTWTPADINSPGFGIALEVGSGNDSPSTVFIDHTYLRVYYSL